MYGNQNSGYSATTTGGTHFNLLLLIGAWIGAAVGYFAGEIIIWMLGGLLHPILLVGVYFAQMMFFIFLAVLICEKIDPRINARIWYSDHWKNSMMRLPLMSIAVFFALGCIFQFIYGLSFAKSAVQQADDYIIVIDNSGSMDSTDKPKERFKAVKSFVDKLSENKNVAVLLFDDYVEIVEPLTKVDDEFKASIETKLSEFNPWGGTDIQLALEEAAAIETESGRDVMVILISDGLSYVDIDKISKLYNDKNIILNTIECGGSLFFGGNDLLLNLSTGTGGMNYQISEMNQLSGTFTTILTGAKSNRMLLDYRYGKEHDSLLFGIMRILFITLIVAAMVVALSFMLYNSAMIKKLLIQKLITGLLAGLILELGLVNFVFLAPFVRLIMAGLIGFLFMFFQSTYERGSGGYGSPDKNNIARW